MGARHASEVQELFLYLQRVERLGVDIREGEHSAALYWT